MTDAQTCGTGLAQHSVLPAKLDDLITAMADVLEAHQRSLVLADRDARAEYDAYAKLIGQQREIADRLRATASQMADYRGLPMGEHDEKELASPEAAEAFRRFVTHEQELVALLQESVAEGRQLLAAMDS
jgi:hypothetical protein